MKRNEKIKIGKIKPAEKIQRLRFANQVSYSFSDETRSANERQRGREMRDMTAKNKSIKFGWFSFGDCCCCRYWLPPYSTVWKWTNKKKSSVCGHRASLMFGERPLAAEQFNFCIIRGAFKPYALGKFGPFHGESVQANAHTAQLGNVQITRTAFA